MSAFPIHCNVAHARQTRHALNRRLHSEPSDSSNDRHKNAKSYRRYSISPKRQNDVKTHVMQDILGEHHKKYFRQFSEFTLTEAAKLRLARPYFVRTISVDGVPHKIIKSSEILEKLQANINAETPQRSFPCAIAVARSSIDSLDSGINSSIAKLTRNLPLATTNS